MCEFPTRAFPKVSLAILLRKAGLASFLNVSGFLTVFAPTDDAFDRPDAFLKSHVLSTWFNMYERGLK